MENRAARQYVSHVRRRLTCSAASRRQLLLRSRELAKQFAAENPDAGYDDFVIAFGPPGNFAGELLSSLDGGEVENAQRRRRLVPRIVFGCLAAVLCVTAVWGWAQWSRYDQHREKFDAVKDADWVIVQQGSYRVTQEVARGNYEKVGDLFLKNGG